MLTAGAAIADEPPVLREAILFKDLTPPELEKPHELPAHPAVESHAPHVEPGFGGFADYLLMRPRRDAFDFALFDRQRDLIPAGRVHSLNYELKSGVRTGFDYRTASGLDAKFAYTYFRSSADRSMFAQGTETIYPTLTRPGLTDEVRTARATAGLEFNTFDLQVGQTVHRGESVSLRAHGGLAWQSIRQRFAADYDGADANRATVTTRNDFTGFGPTVGLEATLHATKHWHLYGRATGGLMTGTVASPLKETNNAGLTPYADFESRNRRVIPTAGLAVGGGWQSGRVSIRAGYELQHWFNLIEQPRVVGELSEGKLQTRTGDFSMEGLFVQFGLAF
jgi:hypothetical protein